MNIEELELSLRTEFEGQVSNVLTAVRQEVDEFQKRFEAAFARQREELDKTINELCRRLPESAGLDAAFADSVSEHLRLARDDGAQVAALAFGEAEKLKAQDAEPASGRSAGYDLIRDAIADISSKTTQATILQALVDHAARFTRRGAFFIVKNDLILGWKMFGPESADDARVREVHFPASSDTLLSAAVLSKVPERAGAGQYSGDAKFFESLGFSAAQSMYAIPLTARGRSVAVLYADDGGGAEVNAEALETLVRVAGLTVELLAALHSAPAAVPPPSQASVTEPSRSFDAQPEPEAQAAEVEEVAVQPESVAEVEVEAAEYPETAAELVEEPHEEAAFKAEAEAELPQVEAPAEPEIERFETVEAEATAEVEEADAVDTEQPDDAKEFAFGSGDSYDASYAEPETVEVADDFAVVAELQTNGNGHVAKAAEPVVEISAPEPKRSRYSERNMDLPIEVADDERRLHNDARRFARLLVSEIKLYNEQKVAEGREANDLYDRLREAIDRSREMYEKRVQPAVASKYDYFHYELVNSLADGQDGRLGSNYPGATV